MFRKGVVCLILACMMLHCASRMQFLSYLYEHRHDIAYTLGLIVEVPMTMCSSDYDFNAGLTIQDHHDSHGTVPVHFQTQEIILFLSNNGVATDAHHDFPLIEELSFAPYRSGHYPCPSQEILQPPKI